MTALRVSEEIRPPDEGTSMDEVRFSQIVDEVLAGLPQFFQTRLENLAVIVQDYPEPELQRQFPGLLLGLFRGVPKTRQSVFAAASFPQQVFLYQKNIEAVSYGEAELRRQVEKTLKHEIGHYFGLSEEDLRALGY